MPAEPEPLPTTQKPPTPQPGGRNIVVDRHLAWGLVSALAIVIGSIGPWLSADAESLAGASGDGDGWGTLAIGVWAFAWIVFRPTPKPRLLAAVVAGGLAAGVLVRFLRLEGEHAASLGWGLVLVIVGAVSLAAWSIVTLARMPAPKRKREWSRGAWGIVLVVLFVPFSAPGPDGKDSKSLVRQWSDKQTESSDDEAPATSTDSSPSKAEDGCESLGMWTDEGPEGSCSSDDGAMTFHFVNGNSELTLYEIAVRDVTVDMMPVIAGDVRSPVRASGTWAQVTATVRNEGRRPIRIYPAMFSLAVRDASFTPDRGAMRVSRESCLWGDEPLRPGKETTCWVAFDVGRESADDVTHSGALVVTQPSDLDEGEFSQPVGVVRLRDADGGTGSKP